MSDKKQKIAAIAAVAYYIKSEQEAMALTQCYAPQELAKEEAAPPVMNLWGISGRQQQMQMRSMMQLKALHGSRQKI